MTTYTDGYRAGIEAAAGIVNEYRLDDLGADLKDILSAIRALPVPEEAGQTIDLIPLIASILAPPQRLHGWPEQAKPQEGRADR